MATLTTIERITDVEWWDGVRGVWVRVGDGFSHEGRARSYIQDQRARDDAEAPQKYRIVTTITETEEERNAH